MMLLNCGVGEDSWDSLGLQGDPTSPFSSRTVLSVLSRQSVLHIMWPKYWSLSFNISPSIEYSGLIFFRMDWLELLAVQGTLKSLLQHHSPKASVGIVDLKEISLECSLEGLMLKLKLQYFGHMMWRTDSLEKPLMLEDWRQEEKGTTEDETVG